jgi:hypothetical protein
VLDEGASQDYVSEVFVPGTDPAVAPEILSTGMEEPVNEVQKAKRDSKKQWGCSIKKGCQASFWVKQLLHAPHITQVAIISNDHVNRDGLRVHGEPRAGDRCAHSAHLSDEVRLWVADSLRRPMTPSQIMAKHYRFLREVIERGEEVTRDMMITAQDIRNIAKEIAMETYMLHPNDAQSVRMWRQRHPESVFYYSETGDHVRGELSADNMPFTLGIQTPWQRKMMVLHGNKGGVSVDATFGTNEKKVCALAYVFCAVRRRRCVCNFMVYRSIALPTTKNSLKSGSDDNSIVY